MGKQQPSPRAVSLYCNGLFYLITVDTTNGLVLSLHDLIQCITKDARHAKGPDDVECPYFAFMVRRYLGKDARYPPQTEQPIINGRQFVTTDMAIKVCTYIANKRSNISYRIRNRARDFEDFFTTGEFDLQVSNIERNKALTTESLIFKTRMHFDKEKQEHAKKGLFFYANGLRKKPSAIPPWEQPLDQHVRSK